MSLRIFLSAVFFVLGFGFIFSLVGVLLESVLASVAYDAQVWLNRVGGTLIIFFGLFMLGLIKLPFLQRDRKLKITRRFGNTYLTSFIFGAAFAVGWTPCATVALGAILALASTSPGSAFWLLMAYSLGLGLPFLVVGGFTSQASGLLSKISPAMHYFNLVFGVILIVLGILVFTGNLVRFSNLEVFTNIFHAIGLQSGPMLENAMLSPLHVAIAFTAGLVSFFNPCVLPIVPGFLSYLGASTKHES